MLYIIRDIPTYSKCKENRRIKTIVNNTVKVRVVLECNSVIKIQSRAIERGKEEKKSTQAGWSGEKCQV